jgi:cell wall assembly regulator SMI1
MSIRPVLDALADTLRRVDTPLASQLSEGLASDVIAARLSSLPGHVATEVHDYFAWRNGLRADRAREEELFPEAVMLSLDEALSDYQALCGMAAQVSRQAGVPASSIWDERWLPLFRHPAGGAYHVTVAAGTAVDRAPIFSVVQEDVSAAAVACDSLEALAATGNECFTSGAYVADNGMIREDRQRAAAIIRAHNPVRMQNATAWLPPTS